MAHITVAPTSLVFHVKAASSNPSEIALPVQPWKDEQELIITNKHGNDTIVYAVRTNVPFQFVVKNAEGVLPPRASAVITVQLRRSARRSMPTLSSRFLVQYAIYIPVPDSSNSSQSTGVLESEERLKVAALRLGKEWRGRNIDLYDSGSVVVPCLVTANPPDDVSPETMEALAAKRRLQHDIAVAENLFNSLTTKHDALKTLVKQADDALQAAQEAIRKEQMQWRMPPLIEIIGLLLFVCASVLLVFAL